ncbi:hypothetical protein CC80DRAFT_386337, partial [Byssothecium circinans]
SQITKIADLKNTVLGHARMLYGSERNKFYDIVTIDIDGKYASILSCSQDGTIKFLRKEVNTCALEATRALVDGLYKDAGLLFTKYDVGDQISGQQGFCGSDGKFALDDTLKAIRDSGPVDDTR